MYVELFQITPEPEFLIARAYGVCTGKTEIPVANIQKWIKAGHLSPLEHASATFYIDGISRACLSQLTRHRLCSFSVQSMRYCDVGENGVVVPETVCCDNVTKVLHDMIVRQSQAVYNELVYRGVPKEDARFVLPLATKTKLYMTANLRQWRHIIELRASKHAQWEIRELAMEFLHRLDIEAPSVFYDLTQKFYGKGAND